MEKYHGSVKEEATLSPLQNQKNPVALLWCLVPGDLCMPDDEYFPRLELATGILQWHGFEICAHKCKIGAYVKKILIVSNLLLDCPENVLVKFYRNMSMAFGQDEMALSRGSAGWMRISQADMDFSLKDVTNEESLENCLSVIFNAEVKIDSNPAWIIKPIRGMGGAMARSQFLKKLARDADFGVMRIIEDQAEITLPFIEKNVPPCIKSIYHGDGILSRAYQREKIRPLTTILAKILQIRRKGEEIRQMLAHMDNGRKKSPGEMSLQDAWKLIREWQVKKTGKYYFNGKVTITLSDLFETTQIGYAYVLLQEYMPETLCGICCHIPANILPNITRIERLKAKYKIQHSKN